MLGTIDVSRLLGFTTRAKMTIHADVRKAVIRANNLYGKTDPASLKKVLDACKVSDRSLRRFLKKEKDIGSAAPDRKRLAVQGKVTENDWATLQAILRVEPWLYKHEMAAAIYEATGSYYTARQIRQVLKKNGYIVYHSRAQDEALKAHFRSIVQDEDLFSAEQFFFVDETHSKLKALRRRFGYGPNFGRVVGHANPPGLERISTIAAMTVEGIIALKTVNVHTQGQVTAAVFMDFLENHLLNRCNAYPAPMSILVIDNAPVHPVHLITAACAAKVELHTQTPTRIHTHTHTHANTAA